MKSIILDLRITVHSLKGVLKGLEKDSINYLILDGEIKQLEHTIEILEKEEKYSYINNLDEQIKLQERLSEFNNEKN